jgi:DNA mismatch endonuclease (patch repair protein)
MRPELAVRKLIHGMGYRYRLHGKNLPGKPDLVFSGKKKVIFVHGCFWHQHNDPHCKDGRTPQSNRAYWNPKLERNKKRDVENQVKLKDLGWKVSVIWECHVKERYKLVKTIKKFLDGVKPKAS